MSKYNINSKQGFTIIEVVLVLAIAGLIFLMVFIALPNLQRSQRDTQRRNDYSQLSANMTAYMTNNNGKLPADGYYASEKYINADGSDPNGLYYSLQVKTCAATCAPGTPTTVATKVTAVTTGANAHKEIPVGASQVFVMKNAKCDGGVVKYDASSRSFAVYGYLESGNGTYCQSNS